MDNIALRFIRWSAGLLVLGLLTGYGPLGHYLMAGVKVAGFYYEPEKAALNLWLSIDGVFLSLYGVGCIFFLAAVLRSTRYAPQSVRVL
jgi:hypothetical protein